MNQGNFDWLDSDLLANRDFFIIKIHHQYTLTFICFSGHKCDCREIEKRRE